MSEPQLDFARFEFKYILPLDLRLELERELQFFVQYDPFVATRPDKKYFVRSLYFDDQKFSSFYEKTDGLHSRSKFRIRTYTEVKDNNVPIFLEIKGPHNNLVYKHRTQILEKGHGITSPIMDFLKPSLGNPDAKPVLKKFEFDYYRKSLVPVALIDYNRRPYVSKYDPEFRLTFDERIRATATNTLMPLNGYQSKNILCGYTVMEVKFRYRVPSWFHKIIQSYELNRVSVSKIVAGIKVLGLAEDMS